MSKNTGVSIAVVRRLPRYYRYLGELLERGVDRVSSKVLADMLNLTASQIRQDFNCFGGFGQQGYGYNVSALRAEIKNILSLSEQYDTIIIGAGNLGKAFVKHMDFSGNGFNVVAVFDNNEKIIGTNVGGVTVRDSAEMEEFCYKYTPKMAVICVPESAAQKVITSLISYGIEAFWNFSHYDIALYHKDILVENVHLGDSLMTLCYRISEQE